MSIAEIKASLHTVIDNIDDEEALTLYLRLMLREVEGQQAQSFTVTPEQQLAIDQAISSLDAGKGTPHKVVKERLKAKYPGIVK